MRKGKKTGINPYWEMIVTLSWKKKEKRDNYLWQLLTRELLMPTDKIIKIEYRELKVEHKTL